MDKEAYICRRCGLEFKAIPGEEEPPECPECESDEVEKLELATIGRTTERSPGRQKNLVPVEGDMRAVGPPEHLFALGAWLFQYKAGGYWSEDQCH